MKRTRRKADGGLSFEDKLGAMDEAAAVFSLLAGAAGDLARGGESAAAASVLDSCRGTVARLASVAKANPDAPGPLAELGRVAAAFEVLCEMPRTCQREEGLARESAADLVAECRMREKQSRHFLLFEYERERMRAECSAEVAEVQVELAKVKGDKANYRKWKRRAKSDREAVSVLDMARLLSSGQTMDAAAAGMGVSLRTAERLARLARARGILGRRKPGRRKAVSLVGGAAGAIAVENAGRGLWEEEDS